MESQTRRPGQRSGAHHVRRGRYPGIAKAATRPNLGKLLLTNEVAVISMVSPLDAAEAGV